MILLTVSMVGNRVEGERLKCDIEPLSRWAHHAELTECRNTGCLSTAGPCASAREARHDAGRSADAQHLSGTMNTDNPLLGSWQLVRWDITYSDGRRASLPYGEHATGLIVYTGDGFMSACIAASARAPLSSVSARSAPAAERLAAFESYFQYAGRYELREAAGGLQVVHRVSHSLNPNFVGSEQVRTVEFDADGVLTLSASDTVPNSPVARHHRLMWKRAAA
jgi:hypothetical protein